MENWEKTLNLGDGYLKTSAKSELARARFNLGLLCLHNFMYDLAIEFFEKAQADERLLSGRDYPMALWGAAMSTKWILWQHSDCQKGKKYLKKIPEQHDWISKMEAAFIATGFELYPKNLECKKDSENQRERRLMIAMKDVMRRFPKEAEAKLFYGVSKAATLSHPECHNGISMAKSCKQELKEARELLQDILEKHPTHSGAIHNTIHIFDVFSDTFRFFADTFDVFADTFRCNSLHNPYF